MEQLRMHWKNDGAPANPPVIPEGFAVVTFPELENALDKWLDIMQYGLSGKLEDADYYRKCMLDLPGYEEEKCFFVLENGKAVASITVVCNYETKAGLFHMVGSLPECRGKGVGKMLGSIGEYVLKTAGMQTASLKTDDFRVPAIKVYLGVGFLPDLSTEDFVQRWDAIFRTIKEEK